MNNAAWLHHLRQERLRQSSRNPGLAALMSFCLMGLGQIYAGHVDRGIMLVFVHVGGLICSYSIFTKGIMYDSLAGLLPPSMLIGFFYVAGVAMILLWIYNIKEAYYLSIFAGFRDWFEVERVMLPGATGDGTKLLSQWGVPNMPGMGAFGPTPGSTAGGALPSLDELSTDDDEVIGGGAQEPRVRRSREPFADDEDESIPVQPRIKVGRDTAPRPPKGKSAARAGVSPRAAVEAEPAMAGSGEEEFEVIPTSRRKPRSESAKRTDDADAEVSSAPAKKGRRRRVRQLFAAMRDQGPARWALGLGVVLLAAAALFFWNRRDDRETLSLAGDFAAIGRILPASGEDDTIGIALLHRGLIASAVERLEIAVSRDSTRPELWQALLQGVRQLGVPERHAQTLKRYLEKFPRDIERAVELAGVQRSRREFVDASRLLTSALAADPTHVRANFLFGAIYRELGMAEEAIAPLKRAVNGDPLNPEFNLELGSAYLALRNAKLARKYLEKALAVEYRNEAAQRLLAQLDELVGSGGDTGQTEIPIETAAVPEPHPGAPIPAPFPNPSWNEQGNPRVLYPPEPVAVPVPQVAPPLPPALPTRLPVTDAGGSPQRDGVSGQAGIGGRSGGLGVVLFAAPGFEKRNPSTGGTPVTPRPDGRPVILDPRPTVVSSPLANEPVRGESAPVAAANDAAPSDGNGAPEPPAEPSAPDRTPPVTKTAAAADAVQTAKTPDPAPTTAGADTIPENLEKTEKAQKIVEPKVDEKPEEKIAGKGESKPENTAEPKADEKADKAREPKADGKSEAKASARGEGNPAKTSAKPVVPGKPREGEVDFAHAVAVEDEGEPVTPKSQAGAAKSDSPIPAQTPSSKPTEKDPLAQGREKYLSGRWEEALPPLLESLKKRENPEAYGMVGHIFQKLGMQEDGYGATLRAYQLGQRDGASVARLGTLAAGAGHHQDAAKYLREALSKSSKRMDLRLRLAESLRKSGDLDGARKELESVLANDELGGAVRRKVERELATLNPAAQAPNAQMPNSAPGSKATSGTPTGSSAQNKTPATPSGTPSDGIVKKGARP